MGRTQECAVLFGIPVTRGEFEAAASHVPRSDYMHGLLRGNSPDSVWDADYGRVAGAAQQLIRTAHELGVSVYQRATLRDFSHATTHFPVVILFSHWRGAMFRGSDLAGDIQAIIDRLRQDSVLQPVRPKSANTNSVVDALNAAVQNLSLIRGLPREVADSVVSTPSVAQTLSRDLIDEAMSGLIEPGNRVEMFDGLHSLREMESALWKGFAGELDLALCNSEAFATFIDLRRSNAIRHLHWPYLLLPVPQLMKVEATLQIMAKCNGDYISTRLSLEELE